MQTFALTSEAPDQPQRLLSLDLNNGSAAFASPLPSDTPTASWRGIAGGAQHIRARTSLARAYLRALASTCVHDERTRPHAFSPLCAHGPRGHARQSTAARLGFAWQEQGSS